MALAEMWTLTFIWLVHSRYSAVNLYYTADGRIRHMTLSHRFHSHTPTYSQTKVQLTRRCLRRTLYKGYKSFKKPLRVFPLMLRWKRQRTRFSCSVKCFVQQCLCPFCHLFWSSLLDGGQSLPAESQSPTEPILVVVAFRVSCSNYTWAHAALAPMAIVQVSPAALSKRSQTASSRRHAGAGEGTGIPWGLQGDSWGRGGPLRATQISIMQLPQQFLVLHGEPLVDFGLLLQWLLQNRLLGGKLPGNCHMLVHPSFQFFILLLESLQLVNQCCIVIHQFLHFH